MSRNKSRLTTDAPKIDSPPIQGQPHTPQRPPEPANPFGISFVVPTEEVEIPSRGLMYPEGHPMHGRTKLEIRQMTSKEEDLLTNIEYLRDGTLIDRLIDSILVDNSIVSSGLFEGDKNAIILRARTTAYGPEYIVSGTCEACGQETSWEFDLRKISCPTDTNIGSEVESLGPGLIRFQLPNSGLEATVKVATPQDHKYIEDTKKKHRELNLPFNETASFIKHILVEVQGTTDKTLISQLVDVLTPLDIRKIKVAHNRANPSLITEQDVSCKICGHVSRKEVPFTEGFFWPDL